MMHNALTRQVRSQGGDLVLHLATVLMLLLCAVRVVADNGFMMSSNGAL